MKATVFWDQVEKYRRFGGTNYLHEWRMLRKKSGLRENESFGVLTAVTMTTTVFLDVTSCDQEEVYRRFGRTDYFQEWRMLRTVSGPRENESFGVLTVVAVKTTVFWDVTLWSLQSGIRRKFSLPKHRQTSTALQGDISQRLMSLVTAMRTSNQVSPSSNACASSNGKPAGSGCYLWLCL